MDYLIFHLADSDNTAKNEVERWRALCGGAFKETFQGKYVYADTREIFDSFAFCCESVGMADIVRMIENKCVFLPTSKKVSVTDVRLWVKAGFIPVFMRAKDFARWKKDFENWV
jgi:hypothetical protein